MTSVRRQILTWNGKFKGWFAKIFQIFSELNINNFSCSISVIICFGMHKYFPKITVSFHKFPLLWKPPFKTFIYNLKSYNIGRISFFQFSVAFWPWNSNWQPSISPRSSLSEEHEPNEKLQWTQRPLFHLPDPNNSSKRSKNARISDLGPKGASHH